MGYMSIPGMNHAGQRTPRYERHASEHPGAKEFLASRAATSHDASGFELGQVEQFRGDACKVIHEERDQHTGEVRTVVQRSVRGDAGLYKVVWSPDGPRTMRIRDVSRTT